MSTYGHSLYRPIKIADITYLGFQIEPHESGRLCIKIHKDKLTEQLEWWKAFNDYMDFRNDEYEWYYLFLDNKITHRNQECVWSFARYNVNYPALEFLLEGLHKLGYKLKVEGERYNYQDAIVRRKVQTEIMRKKILEKHNQNNLVESEN